MFGKDDPSKDDDPTVPDDDDASKAHTLTKHERQLVKDKKGTDGEEADKHVKGKDKKSTRMMFGDWTIYDEEEDPGHGPGRREPPDTHVSRPDSRWHDRLPEKGNAGQFSPPLFARR
jgi:hypothetical protein